MLVLSRRSNSSVKIGSDVTVTVLSIKRQQVRLGIDAPKGIRVLRDELYDEELADAQPADTGTSIVAPRMKIVLVIEDDPLHATMIRKSLCGIQGTMVTVVETAKLALDALGVLAGSDNDDEVHPDLILLDVNLPDGSGVEVLRSIRKDDRLRRTPVVMLSCCQDDGVVDACTKAGANAFVVKSTRWDDFRSSVSRIGQFWTNDYFIPQRSPDPSRVACRPSTTN
jgi:carbon storage regulator CsrA